MRNSELSDMKGSSHDFILESNSGHVYTLQQFISLRAKKTAFMNGGRTWGLTRAGV